MTNTNLENKKITNSDADLMIDKNNLQVSYFAGGCFWCMEAAFEEVAGVSEVISGYSGGDEENPTYEEVSTGKSGHIETVKVFYDPKIVSYEHLVEVFWRQIDPTDADGQFSDKGSQYVTAIFYETEEQKKTAELSKKNLEDSKVFDKPIVTGIVKFKNFYEAEEYHQNYYKKNILNYYAYEKGSGRKDFTEDTWKDIPLAQPEIRPISDDEDETNNYYLNKLTKLEYQVTQNGNTERAFDNEYWDNHEPGIYVDVVSGQVLFTSIDKYDSDSGWPSFTKPISENVVIENVDKTSGITRTEIKSSDAESHLGHLFNDGPNGGDRFCINSASLNFIHVDDLEKEGYGEYLELFKE